MTFKWPTFLFFFFFGIVRKWTNFLENEVCIWSRHFSLWAKTWEWNRIFKVSTLFTFVQSWSDAEDFFFLRFSVRTETDQELLSLLLKLPSVSPTDYIREYVHAGSNQRRLPWLCTTLATLINASSLQSLSRTKYVRKRLDRKTGGNGCDLIYDSCFHVASRLSECQSGIYDVWN